MMPFLHSVHSKQSRDSLTGPEGRANVGRPFATERLKDAISFRNKRVKKQQTLHLVHFV